MSSLGPSTRVRRALRVALAVAFALGVNATLVWCLTALQSKVPAPRERSALRGAVPLDPVPPPRAPRREEPLAVGTDEPDPDPMEIDLDLDQPALADVDPLPIELDLPSPVVPRVTIRVANAPGPARSAPERAVRGAPLDAEGIDTPPRPLAGNASPRYPSRERRMGVEDVVRARLLIDESGRVVEVEIVEGGGAFVEAVRRAVERWRFTPPEHEGRSVRAWGLKSFSFELGDR
ncbi:MAG: energy transducer TonB [Planctomycetota bacterium]